MLALIYYLRKCTVQIYAIIAKFNNALILMFSFIVARKNSNFNLKLAQPN